MGIDNFQKTVLQELAKSFKRDSNTFISNDEVAGRLGKSPEEVRLCMEELSNSGYLEITDASSYSEKRCMAKRLTYQGWKIVD